MTMHGALHPKSDVDSVYLSKEMGGRELISCERCVRVEKNNLGWYVRDSFESLIEGVKAAETIECNNTVNKKEFKQLDEGKEGTTEKQKNVWAVCKRNASQKQQIKKKHGTGQKKRT